MRSWRHYRATDLTNVIYSIIPDYLVPSAAKTVLASSVAAGLHVVAAVIIVGLLLNGYQRRLSRGVTRR